MEFIRNLTITQAVIILTTVVILLVVLVVTSSRPLSDEELFATNTPVVNYSRFALTATPTLAP